MLPLSSSDLTRLFGNIDHSGGPDACWPWKASTNSGYGQIMFHGRMCLAHRVVCGLMHGLLGIEEYALPDGIRSCHSCDNPICCNPWHLFPGTDQDNVLDCVAKGRHRNGGAGKFGQKNPNSYYTDEQVAEIQRLLATSLTQRQIAAQVGCTQRLVSQIFQGKAHANLGAMPKRINKYAGPDDEKKLRIQELRSAGVGVYETARLVGCTPRAVNRVCPR